MIPYMAMIKLLTNLISHSTERRRKRVVHFNHTMSDFALEDSLSTVDSRYLEIEGTLKNSSRYPYFDISDL